MALSGGMAGLAIASLLYGNAPAAAQEPGPPPAVEGPEPARSVPEKLLRVPITGLVPGDVKVPAEIANPSAGDPEAATRGMRYFNSFNCIGCHAPNGGGGMGPALSNAEFIYGSEPEKIYLSIHQGRPNGMPAWGSILPDKVIWDLVAYVQSISKEAKPPWGRTTSLQAFDVEQVPAEFMKTANPWKHTQPFSYGQKPMKKAKP